MTDGKDSKVVINDLLDDIDNFYGKGFCKMLYVFRIKQAKRLPII